MLKTVMLHDIFVETVMHFIFKDTQMNIQFKRSAFIRINIIDVFTVTFHQFNASLINKSIGFSEINAIFLSVTEALVQFQYDVS